ncbi:MAG: hypothetical protein R2932_43155 [Caldilineaceae bacterium]
MNYRSNYLLLCLLLPLILLLPMPAQARLASAKITGSTDTDMYNSDGQAITAGGFSTIGDVVRASSESGDVSLAPRSQPPSLLAARTTKRSMTWPMRC